MQHKHVSFYQFTYSQLINSFWIVIVINSIFVEQSNCNTRKFILSQNFNTFEQI